MSDLSQYSAWLVDQGYQTSTIGATLRHLKVVADNPDEVGYRAPHVRRYLLYVVTTKRNPLGRKFTDRMMVGHGLEAVTETRKTGGTIKQLLNGGQWYELHQTLRQGGDLDKLIVAYMESPYKISEFLDLRIKNVDEDTVQHKWSRKWMHQVFVNPRGKQVYQILCQTRRCAYSRMRRRLTAVSKGLGFKADLDTLYKTFNQRAETK